ncbi:FBP domain-containing protein [Amycolatopsis sp. PS_44_ISF1]|uniref:FBP domain-containing protein n=1 Tax=Amycolatopsis sp. PS_44_ISF1 TaxID=2974917 RepID=UPI0028DEE851|nr:FBP domain-containing protein [Amycolatopsis sp. PS_44_ISF1]MDT8910217.1 FBP domain-containing protein [Amycolatopsis sp. PS_44_ISF1]
MQPLEVDQIRASFVNCSRGEAKTVTVPGEVPWADRDFLGWRDPKAPARAYLVLPYEGEVIGLALRAAPPARSRVSSNMCAFCSTTHRVSDISLFSGRRAGKLGREGNTLGTYICANLACSRYVRREIQPEIPQPNEWLTLEERIERLEDKVHRFVARVLESR